MKNRTVIGIICIAASLIIAFAVLPAVSGRMNGTVSVLRLRRDVPAGSILTRDDLEQISVGALNLPQDVISDLSRAVGKYAAGQLFAGDLLTGAKLRDRADGAADRLSRLEEGEMAVTVAISSFAAGFSGQLSNGDLVRIYVSGREGTFSPEELSCVRVITTVTGEAALRDSAGVSGQDGMSLPASIMFAVNPEQAAKLFEYSSSSSVCCAFLCHADDEKAEGYLAAQQEWFASRDRSEETGEGEERDNAASGVIEDAARIIGGDLPGYGRSDPGSGE